jgi:hypothetical protein
MSDQNKYAIIGMFAIVITLYALRDSHTHILPDLFGLALALTAPRQSYAIGAVAILALIRHSPLAHGLAGGVPMWLWPIVLPAARNMSIAEDEARALESAYKARLSAENSTDEIDEIPQPVGENRDELITFGETRALARLVAQERIGLTEAVKIGAGAKSGAKYQRRSAEVKAELERIRNHYPAGSTHKRFE